MQTVQNVLDVQRIELHQPAFYDFLWLVVPGNADHFPVCAAGLRQNIQDSFKCFLLSRVIQNEDIELQFCSEIFFIALIIAHSIRIPSRIDRILCISKINIFIFFITWS